jgi:GT2 family glycosyltransferase
MCAMPELSTSVVLASWQRPAALLRCLDGLRAQALEPAEVVVAIRQEDSDSSAALSGYTWPRVRTILVSSPGAVAARNAAIAASSADVIAFIDDDAVPRPDWTQRLVAHYADPRVGAVGGRDFVYHDGVLEEGEEPVVGRVLPYGRFVGFHHLGHGAPREVDLLKGANMSVRAEALAGRGFDPELRGDGAEHHEDWTLSLRVKRNGWRVIFDPAANVDHYEAARAGGDPRVRPSGSALSHRVHNQTYAAVRYLPWPRAFAHVVFVLLVGTTVGPGLAQGLRHLSRSGDVRNTGVMLAASLRGRLSGVLRGLRGRRRDQIASGRPQP